MDMRVGGNNQFEAIGLPDGCPGRLRHANHLNLCCGGGQGRNRTADASLFRAALYRLSYLAVGWKPQCSKPLLQASAIEIAGTGAQAQLFGFLVYSACRASK